MSGGGAGHPLLDDSKIRSDVGSGAVDGGM